MHQNKLDVCILRYYKTNKLACRWNLRNVFSEIPVQKWHTWQNDMLISEHILLRLTHLAVWLQRFQHLPIHSSWLRVTEQCTRRVRDKAWRHWVAFTTSAFWDLIGWQTLSTGPTISSTPYVPFSPQTPLPVFINWLNLKSLIALRLSRYVADSYFAQCLLL